MATRWSIVVVEDEEKVAHDVAKLVAKAGLEAVLAENLEEAIVEIDRLVQLRRLAGVVSDLKLPGQSRKTEYGGWDAISHANSVSPGCPIAIYSARFDEFAAIVSATSSIPAFRAFKKSDDILKLEKWLLDVGVACRGAKSAIVFDPKVVDIYEKLAPVYAPSDLPVLIIGQSGTGKETLAREIHAKSNLSGPFVPVNCAALDDGLVLAELFGSESGAWTDSHAHKLGLILHASGYVGDPKQAQVSESFLDWLEASKEGQVLEPKDPAGDPDLYSLQKAAELRGTLFLDEVTCLPHKAMGALLRALSTKDVRPYGFFGPGFRVHCRIIAATNDMAALQDSDVGSEAVFRRDLFYRLGGVIFSLPEVRDPTVIAAFATSQAVWTSMGLPQPGFASLALQLIFDLYAGKGKIELAYQRGNFRTLRNLLHRAGLIAARDGDGEIRTEHVQAAIELGVVLAATPLQPSPDASDLDAGSALLRREFLSGLRAHGVSLESWFSLSDLQRLSAKAPLAVADAFLRCCQCKRPATPGGKTDYSLEEIEEALTSKASRRAWLSKGLTAEMVSAAAVQFYDIPSESTPGTKSTINEVVKLLRHLGGKRKRVRPASH